MLKMRTGGLRRGNNTVGELAGEQRVKLTSWVPKGRLYNIFHSRNTGPTLGKDKDTIPGMPDERMTRPRIHNSSITACPSMAGAMAFRMAANRLAARVTWRWMMGTAPW